MKRSLVWLVPLGIVAAGCDLDLTGLGGCRYDRSVYQSINVSGSDVLRVIAEAGNLRVEGRPGASDVRVRGTACAESQRDLNAVDVVLQRVGSSIRVLTYVPAGAGVSAHADIVIEVPEWMLVDIDHREGDISITDVAGVSILDDSGNIVVSDIDGDVEIDDGSGDLQVSDISGDVWLLDESGTIDVRRVSGGVDVEADGSGDMLIRDVQFDVWVGEDGSGDIVVENVRGDFIVDIDDSGSISYRNVGGAVFLPR